MGVDTNLYISKRFDLDDIFNFIKLNIDKKVTVTSKHKASIGFFYFGFTFNKEKRNMRVFENSNFGNQTFILLNLDYDKNAIEIMEKIANCFGGLLIEKDYEDKIKHIPGKFSDENGLSYFLKYAFIRGLDENDLKGLNKVITKWQKEISSSSKIETYKIKV